MKGKTKKENAEKTTSYRRINYPSSTYLTRTRESEQERRSRRAVELEVRFEKELSIYYVMMPIEP